MQRLPLGQPATAAAATRSEFWLPRRLRLQQACKQRAVCRYLSHPRVCGWLSGDPSFDATSRLQMCESSSVSAVSLLLAAAATAAANVGRASFNRPYNAGGQYGRKSRNRKQFTNFIPAAFTKMFSSYLAIMCACRRKLQVSKVIWQKAASPSCHPRVSECMRCAGTFARGGR